MTFLDHLKPSHLPESVLQKDVLNRQREVILQYILNILLGIYTLGLGVVLAFLPQVIRSGRGWIYVIFYLVLVFLTITRNLNYYLRAVVVILTLQALGVMALISYGLSGTGLIFLFASVLLGSLLFDHLASMVFLAGALVEISAVGGMMVSGRISLPPIEVLANSGNGAQWITAALVFIFSISITAISIINVVIGLRQALTNQEELAQALVVEQTSLEQRVEDRSADLQKRVHQFEIASQIAREISGENNLAKLLDSAVNQVRDRFGFYYVGIFLQDEQGEYAVLRAATGEVGQAMLMQNHRLKTGTTSIVGYVVDQGEARMVMDVNIDPQHYKNPMLPKTRSELGLPLRSGSKTIGALDVQSASENAFSPEDVSILQTIADQLAIAFDKVRLVDELQRSVAEMEETLRSTTQKTWHGYLKNARRVIHYRYRNEKVEPEAEITPLGLLAAQKGEPVLTVEQPSQESKGVTKLAVPIKLRNQVLGVVDIRFDSGVVSQDLIGLIEGTVGRLAVSLENARLMEEIQYRAERERLVSDISSKVRTASEVDRILRITAQELGRSLGVSEVMVELHSADTAEAKA